MTHRFCNIDFQLHATFEIPGQPTAKQRPRMGRRGAYTPKKTKDYQRRVGIFAMNGTRAAKIPDGTPVVVLMAFIFKRPKRLMGKKHPDGLVPMLAKPDGDNVEKAVLDGLDGLVFHDDARVFHSSWTKYYSEKDRGPRVEVRVYTPAQQTATTETTETTKEARR